MHNREHLGLFCSANMIKSIIMRWEGHVTRGSGKESCIPSFWGETWKKETARKM